MAGKIVHIELPAQDAGRATSFWGSLMGWRFQSSEFAGYHVFEGEPGGGIYESEQPGTGPIVYYGSEDIAADIARVRELGGKADDRQPIPGIGWCSRCHDTEGNAFSLFQADGAAPAPGE
jgi:uncharacterized protein